MTTRTRWPRRVWIVRHGESLGNVASARAIADDLERIDIAGRDVDVELSPLGERQARSVGAWFATMPEDRRPERIIASSYRRARQTASLIAEAAGLELDIAIDERLRERDFGVLEHLTHKGMHALQPEQDDFRRLLGKFYHRPPGGESWCDVVLRVRSLLDSFLLHHDDQRVLFVCHQVVLLCLRYVFERLDENRILRIDRESDVGNGSVTEYEVGIAHGDPAISLVRYNFVPPLQSS